jgi:acyl-CoA synthetase (AMP-forming)/AMP-acid ligase II
MACVVTRQGETIDTEEFRSWCRENMASYKVPKYVSIRQQLPKNILGKILKKELKSQLKAEGMQA